MLAVHPGRRAAPAAAAPAPAHPCNCRRRRALRGRRFRPAAADHLGRSPESLPGRLHRTGRRLPCPVRWLQAGHCRTAARGRRHRGRPRGTGRPKARRTLRQRGGPPCYRVHRHAIHPAHPPGGPRVAHLVLSRGLSRRIGRARSRGGHPRQLPPGRLPPGTARPRRRGNALPGLWRQSRRRTARRLAGHLARPASGPVDHSDRLGRHRSIPARPRRPEPGTPRTVSKHQNAPGSSAPRIGNLFRSSPGAWGSGILGR